MHVPCTKLCAQGGDPSCISHLVLVTCTTGPESQKSGVLTTAELHWQGFGSHLHIQSAPGHLSLGPLHAAVGCRGSRLQCAIFWVCSSEICLLLRDARRTSPGPPEWSTGQFILICQDLFWQHHQCWLVLVEVPQHVRERSLVNACVVSWRAL